MKTDSERIAERRADTPVSCRKNYDKAMSGKSRPAGVKAFCLECMGWDKGEVKACDTVQCPLFPYRPYRKSKTVRNARFPASESTNAEEVGEMCAPAVTALKRPRTR